MSATARLSRNRASSFFARRRSAGAASVLALGALFAAGVACDQTPVLQGRPGGTAGAAGSAAGGTAGGAEGGAGGAAVVTGKGIGSPAVAILNSDYTTTSLSLYDPASGHLVDACVTSAFKPSASFQPLSGNVMLPTQAQTGGELVIVDSKNAVLTFVVPATCAVRGQLSVSTGGFKSNPHDVVTLSATKAYVTRYEKNPAATPAAADFDDGDDLLIVDPTGQTVTGRIDLGSFSTLGPAGELTQARPDRALLADGAVYVSLNNISGDFGATGAARVVVVDPATDTVTATIDPPGLKNCSGLTYVASTKRLYIACGGAYSEPAAQIAQSGLVEVQLGGAAPVIARVIPASAVGDGKSSLNFFYAAVSGELAFTSTMGMFPDAKTGFAGTSDAFYLAPLGGGAATKLAEGSAGDLGSALVDAASQKVFLPDANFAKPAVHVFDATAGVAAATADFEPNPSTHLPPRALTWY